MNRELTPAEIEKRFKEINQLQPEVPTQEELESMKAAEAADDGTVVTLEQLKQDLEAYSGRLVLRIPRSLHKSLKQEAEIEGVSLNQYMLYKLAK